MDIGESITGTRLLSKCRYIPDDSEMFSGIYLRGKKGRTGVDYQPQLKEMIQYN